MLDARIAASNTHGFAPAAQLATARVDRIVASSHGLAFGLIVNLLNSDEC
jgi:hypothetical protein